MQFMSREWLISLIPLPGGWLETSGHKWQAVASSNEETIRFLARRRKQLVQKLERADFLICTGSRFMAQAAG